MDIDGDKGDVDIKTFLQLNFRNAVFNHVESTEL